LELTETSSIGGIASQTESTLGNSLPTLIPQILELGRATAEGAGSILISYDDLYALEREGIKVFEDIVPWAPFVLEIHSTGSLGTPAFRYNYRFYLGTRQVYPKQYGAFASHSGKTYRLDHSTFSLLRAIDDANVAAGCSEMDSGAWIRFSDIKGLAEDVGAQLDSYIHRERVVIPSEIGVDIDADERGRISLVPNIDGVAPDVLKRSFLHFGEAQDIYSMDHPDGGRIRVILGEKQKEAFRRMQKIQSVFGTEKARVLSNPAAVFDGVADVVRLDDLGPRVEKIGKFPFVSRPYLGSTGVFDPDTEGEGGQPPVIGIECQYPDGKRERIEFKSTAEFKDLLHQVKLSQSEGKGVVEFRGVTITLEPDFIRGMDELGKRILHGGSGSREPLPEKDGRYLLIYRNEDEIDYVEQETGGTISTFAPTLPKAFLDPTLLKNHQIEGVAWLELNYALSSHGRRGCLLADDMGLGKTLQVLTFLAWIIEKGDLSADGDDPESPPWNPILVVTPVILLEDRTWIREVEKFFAQNGSIFTPYLILHGKNIKDLRNGGPGGRETVVGEPVLDLDRLKKNRIIFTNYETVVNYQHSMARIKWAAVVTDEAQEYKTPSSKISHALKSLDPGYRIACTGTPVETRLLDLWNIFDFLQPGSLLGSKVEFSDKYEKPLAAEAESRSEILGGLKNRLRFQKRDSYVKRREKNELTDLPLKHEHVIDCHLSEAQREMHEDFIGRLRSSGPEHHLSMIHNLMFLYQHPDLVRSRDGILRLTAKEIIGACPKLGAVLGALSGIRMKGEKVLIFTRSLVMQQVLAKTIGETFGLRVDIVNGGTKRNVDTKSGSDTRKGIIDRFKAQSGFNVIVLSPDVAGYGLTLTEANHVIHYGRWWNPAKEAQATDRVYRIGQDKEVHVYYPIAKDPRGVFKTFDEKLDALLARRRDLAKDFLMPMPGENDLGRDLLDDILGKEKTSDQPSHLTMNDVCLLPWDRFESLVALLEQKAGRETIVTPSSGDQGIDVLSRQDNNVRIIQCKHSSFAAEIEEEVLGEVLCAFDGYRTRYFAGSMLGMNAVLVTNGKIPERVQKMAREHGITLICGYNFEKLLSKYPCTLAEVELTEEFRCRSIREVANRIETWKR